MDDGAGFELNCDGFVGAFHEKSSQVMGVSGSWRGLKIVVQRWFAAGG